MERPLRSCLDADLAESNKEGKENAMSLVIATYVPEGIVMVSDMLSISKSKTVWARELMDTLETPARLLGGSIMILPSS